MTQETLWHYGRDNPEKTPGKSPRLPDLLIGQFFPMRFSRIPPTHLQHCFHHNLKHTMSFNEVNGKTEGSAIDNSLCLLIEKGSVCTSKKKTPDQGRRIRCLSLGRERFPIRRPDSGFSITCLLYKYYTLCVRQREVLLRTSPPNGVLQTCG